jgi:hypothetical protein
MVGDVPNQTLFDACGGSMAFTIAGVVAGHNVITAEKNAEQLSYGKLRLSTETLIRLDARASTKLKLPHKWMLVHKDDEKKDIIESRFLPKREIVLGWDGDAPEELQALRKQCLPLRVRG